MTTIGQAARAGTPSGGAQSALLRAGLYSSIDHNTRAVSAPALGRLHYMPFPVARPKTLDRIGVEVTAVIPTGVVRLGIYNDAGDFNYPGALLVDAGVVDAASATGLIVAAINVALPGGLYWLAVANQVAAATLRVTTTSGQITALADPTGPTGNVPLALTEIGVAGALPPAATPSGVTNTVPLVFVRAA